MSAQIIPFPMKEHFPNRIREHRKRAKLSLEKLALAIGVSIPTMSDYEVGNIDIPFSRLRAVAVALGVSVGDLLNPEDNPRYASAEEEQWGAMFQNADDEDRERLIRVAAATIGFTPQPALDAQLSKRKSADR